MNPVTFRLKPGQDLLVQIEHEAAESGMQAGVILTCVGSLTQAVVRLADKDSASRFRGPFEILSLAGTVSVFGSHLHICLADGEGHAIGGHVLQGCLIHTTAEISLLYFKDQVFKREMCRESGYPELAVYPAGKER